MLCEDKVIALHCIADDLLKATGHRQDMRRKVSDSEVITTALVSALYFGGHHDTARQFMKIMKFIPSMLDKSRFNRRLHEASELLSSLFFQMGHCIKAIAGATDYVINSFPVAVCDNIRISRSRLLKGKQRRGKQANLRRYFYGVKVQVLTTVGGIPVEFCFVPGSEHDVNALMKLPLGVAAESRIYGDAAYTDYKIEDDMKEAEGIELMIARRSNAKRKDESWIRFLKEQMRKGIETTFSQIKALFLRTLHAVTFKGFLLKLILFILSFTLNKLA